MTATRTATGASRTDESAATRLLLPALLAVFFLSGVSGLIYQVVWVRMLSLTFGVTSYAIATVLCGFMAGLALGAFLAGRFADRIARPLAAYAGAEVLIALAGALSPVLFALLRLVYLALVDVTGLESLLALSLLRFIVAFVVLLVPTTAMGATLPLIVRSSLLKREGMSRNVSLLYGVNTLGAVGGTLAAGFYLIGRYGLFASLVVAALFNLVAAVLALALERTRGEEAAEAADLTTPAERPYPEAAQRAVFVVFGVSGALSLAYEVVWARVLSIFFDATTYGFTVMLATVLLGIALGSWLISPLIARRWNWLLIFAGLEALVGVLGLLAVTLLANIVPITDALGLYADPGALGQFSIQFMTVVSALVVFPPMFLLGMTFPVAARVVGAGHEDVGRRVGAVYAANVCGAIVGSFLGGFVLLPGLGVERSLLLLGACSIALAVTLAWVAPLRRLAAWRPATLAAGVAAVVLAAVLAPDLFTGVFRERLRDQDVVFVDEGLENMATVADNRLTGERKLYLNGQPQASTVSFIAGFHQLIGHTGMLLRPEARRALVIGLGGGATAGAVARHGDAQVEVVELSSAVTNAAPYFSAINGDVLQRPNVRLRVDDGRNYLLLSDQKYDVITADIIRPRHAGAGNLYSTEYYRLAKEALAGDGVMVQWLEQLSEQQYRLLLRTFLEVFPHVSLWADGSLLVGSKQPVTVDPAALAAKFADPELGPALAAIGLTSPQDLLNLYTGDRAEALAYAGPGPVITDNRPYVEYYRSLDGSGDHLPDLSGFSRDQRKVLKP